MADSVKEQNQRGKRRRCRKKKGPVGAAASAGAGPAAPNASAAAQEGFSGKRKKNKDKNNVSDIGTVEEEISRVEQNILRAVVTDFVQSTEENVQLRGLSRLQRSHVHRVAQSMGLKTASKGSADQRVLTITRPAVVDPQQGVVQKPKLTVSSAMLEILSKSSGEMDMNLLRRCTMHRRPKSDRERDLERECERDYLHRPNNNGLVGVAMVPPPSQCHNRNLVQERVSLPIYSHRSKILSVLQNEQVSPSTRISSMMRH